MHGPTIQTAEWYRYLSDLYGLNDSKEIPQKLAVALQYLSRGDSVLVMVYFPHKRPVLLYADIDHNNRKNNFDEYLQGFYLLDPFYQMTLTCKDVTLSHLKDICENKFYDSEYYESWYKQSGLKDELNYLIPLEQDAVAAISLSRNMDNSFFSPEKITQLDIIKPLISTLMKKYWDSQNPLTVEEENREQGLHGALCKAMENFGRSCLTDREMEITQYLLRGYGIKATAMKLDIAPSTIKVHRKNIYRKLDITSHSELFTLFIDALSVGSGIGDDDPLLHYNP
ncbi:MAG: helix-turn-helix transcriptional regulator [Emcibacter sp.]|nr:helix-turn-helix transcriptional regulator [Emcibacter sp.]